MNPIEHPEPSSYALDSTCHKQFRILIIPSATGAVTVRPKEPEPSYETRHSPPSIDNISDPSKKTRPIVRTKGALDKEKGSTPHRCSVGERRPAWTTEAYARITQHEAEVAYIDCLVNREGISKRRPPRDSDLSFNKFCWNMKSPVRTERESKREGFVSLTSALENTTVDPFGIEITTAIIQAAQRRGYIKPVDRELLAIARRLQKGQTQREIARQMGLTERAGSVTSEEDQRQMFDQAQRGVGADYLPHRVKLRKASEANNLLRANVEFA